MLAMAALIKCLRHTQVMAPKLMTGVLAADNEAQQTCGQTTDSL
jgi:hypothetical protein